MEVGQDGTRVGRISEGRSICDESVRVKPSQGDGEVTGPHPLFACDPRLCVFKLITRERQTSQSHQQLNPRVLPTANRIASFDRGELASLHRPPALLHQLSLGLDHETIN